MADVQFETKSHNVSGSAVPLSLLTWNVNFRSAETLEPLARLPELPDIVLLQEVALGKSVDIQARLSEIGYPNVIYSGDADAANKRYGNVIATKLPCRSISLADAGLPWPQLVAHAELDTPRGQIHVINVHVPNGSGNGWKKIHTLRALRLLIERLSGQQVILAGDFNEPQYVMQGEHVVTWGQRLRRNGQWQPWSRWTFDGETGTGEDWDAAVRWFFENPGESAIRNAYWDATGHGSMEPSHLSRGMPRWFDHIFVSGALAVESCRFLHAFREDGFSDHSGLLAELSSSSPLLRSPFR